MLFHFVPIINTDYMLFKYLLVLGLRQGQEQDSNLLKCLLHISDTLNSNNNNHNKNVSSSLQIGNTFS
jgi:hypothetical protein